MELANPVAVAALALTYRELNAEWDPIGGRLSLAADTLARLLEETGGYEYDSVILDTIAENPAGRLRIARSLATDPTWHSPARAEAILHAWPRHNGEPPRASWAKPFRGLRWESVEQEMEHLLRTGLAVPRGHVAAIAEAAYQVAGGT